MCYLGLYTNNYEGTTWRETTSGGTLTRKFEYAGLKLSEIIEYFFTLRNDFVPSVCNTDDVTV
jgi:hypothetical protein